MQTTRQEDSMTATIDTYTRDNTISDSRWIRDSRARYGQAYFLSVKADGSSSLWMNQMPFAPNVRVADFPNVPTTWDEIDNAVYGIAV